MLTEVVSQKSSLKKIVKETKKQTKNHGKSIYEELPFCNIKKCPFCQRNILIVDLSMAIISFTILFIVYS